MSSTFSLDNTYTSASNRVCGLIEPLCANTWPRLRRLARASEQYTYVVSGSAFVSNFLNISTPVHIVTWVGLNPTISTLRQLSQFLVLHVLSPPFLVLRSRIRLLSVTRRVCLCLAWVRGSRHPSLPLTLILRELRYRFHLLPTLLALNDDDWGLVSWELVLVRRSLTSISTNSNNSASSTMSALFMYTTM